MVEAIAMHLQSMDLQSNVAIGDAAAAMPPPPPTASAMPPQTARTKKEPVQVKQESAKDPLGMGWTFWQGLDFVAYRYYIYIYIYISISISISICECVLVCHML